MGKIIINETTKFNLQNIQAHIELIQLNARKTNNPTKKWQKT